MYLKLLNYRINESSFKTNPIPPGVNNFRINPNIRMDIKKSPTDFFMMITASVKPQEGEKLPFEFEVKLSGNFKITDTAADVDALRIEASKLLYPYVRSYVATMTAGANMMCYHLPLLDFDTAPASKQTEVTKPAAPGTLRKPDTSKGDTIIIRPIDEV